MYINLADVFINSNFAFAEFYHLSFNFFLFPLAIRLLQICSFIADFVLVSYDGD